jgi:hypothetical protein
MRFLPGYGITGKTFALMVQKLLDAGGGSMEKKGLNKPWSILSGCVLGRRLIWGIGKALGTV